MIKYGYKGLTLIRDKIQSKELKEKDPETGKQRRDCAGCIMDAAAIAEIVLFSE